MGGYFDASVDPLKVVLFVLNALPILILPPGSPALTQCLVFVDISVCLVACLNLGVVFGNLLGEGLAFAIILVPFTLVFLKLIRLCCDEDKGRGERERTDDAQNFIKLFFSGKVKQG